MNTKNDNLFAQAISIEKMEPRLELAAAASKNPPPVNNGFVVPPSTTLSF